MKNIMKNIIKSTTKNIVGRYQSIIILFVVFIFIIIGGSLFKPFFEGYTDYNFYDPSSSSIEQLKKEKVDNIVGYLSLNDDICKFPNCNEYALIQGSWVNKYSRSPITQDSTKYQDSTKSTKSSPKITERVLLNPMRFLNYNISAPECCEYNQSYSTSNGCLCITPEQYKFLSNRGGNR
tara:strand:- start:151 stop:687 length:537 start_codon:yes stop_codon:yes gene_type:complete